MNKEELLYSAEEHGRRYEMLEEIERLRLESDQKTINKSLMTYTMKHIER